jgi:uncharacterized protein
MSKDYLPIQVDPVRFAENATHLHGTLLVKNLERLGESLMTPAGEVTVDLQFGIDQQRIRFLKGHCETELTLQCQRCLEPFQYKIVGNFNSAIVGSEEAEKELPESYDPLLIDPENSTLNLQDLVEEELIISLPIVFKHDLQDCKIKTPYFVAGDAVNEKESPFKVIEFLKEKLKKD